MSLEWYEDIVVMIPIISLAIAVFLFLKTPPDKRWSPTKPEQNPNIHYAPLFTSKEKIIQSTKMLAWTVPVILIMHFYIFPKIDTQIDNFKCRNQPFEIIDIIYYTLFFGIPFIIAIFIFISEGLDAIKTIKLKQSPLPNQKTFKLTADVTQKLYPLKKDEVQTMRY